MILAAVGLDHIPTLQTSPAFDGLRAATSIYSGLLIVLMVKFAWKTRNYGFYALSVFVFLTAVNEADQIGQPVIVYQLPLRILGLAFATYWLYVRSQLDRI